MAELKRRFQEVDAARGAAVVGMVVYHFAFHLYYFAHIPISPLSGAWWALARGTAWTFFLLVGVSLWLSRSLLPGRTTWNYIRRGAFIFACGLLVTAVTALFEPDAIIYFGALHFIGAATALACTLTRRPWIAFVLALGVFSSSDWVRSLRVDTSWLVWLGAHPTGFRTLDYYPLFPHLGVVFLGIGCGWLFYPEGERRFELDFHSPLLPLSGLSWLGRHSLAIFLIHQPLSIGLVLLVAR